MKYREGEEEAEEKLTLGRAKQSPKEVTDSRTARACRHARTYGMKT